MFVIETTQFHLIHYLYSNQTKVCSVYPVHLYVNHYEIP